MIWKKAQVELLRDEINTVLAYLSSQEDFTELIRDPLNKMLPRTDDSGRPWQLLPLIVCEAISGDFKAALPAAASLQFMKAAAEVFDDIEDADSSTSLSARYGNALATNAATTLLILAERAISCLKLRNVQDSKVIRVMDLITSFYTTACIGQHLDLSSSPAQMISEEIYFKIAGMKSATTVECACRVGAVLATEDPLLIDKLSLFGHNLGMSAQIANDLLGITRKSDVLARKITLPVIYALQQSQGRTRKQLEATFLRKTEDELDASGIKALLFSTGAVHYTTVKLELFKGQARDILSEIESKGVNVERLKPFLN
jgi:geranylgeranyl pyrophosphate synthase